MWANQPSSSSVVEQHPTKLNSANCSDKVVIKVSPDKLSVRHLIENKGTDNVGIVQANHPAPVNVFTYYFEMSVLNSGSLGSFGIGFTPSDHRMYRHIGWDANSYGYHGDNGHLYREGGRGQPFGTTYTVGDTVGAGINNASHKIFFTKNGVIVGTTSKTNKDCLLFPSVATHSLNEVVTVNFGKEPFLFDIKAYEAQKVLKLQATLEKITSLQSISHENEFHQEDGRRDLAEMIILHEYPVSMVEHYGFRKLCKTLQPKFEVPCSSTTWKDIMKRYHREKEDMVKLLKITEGKIALTMKMWTLISNQKTNYIEVTAHFIDNTWKLQNRTLRFLRVEAPHTKEMLTDALCKSIYDWNLDCRISSVTLDNFTTTDALMPILRAKLPKDSLILRGKFLHMRCCAHILNLIVQDGLSVIGESIESVRNSVLFWTSSVARVTTFENVARAYANNYSKKLVLDCKARWNSTYEMLKVAIMYKDVFNILSSRESDFCKRAPLKEDWDHIERICEKLEVFSEATFSGTKYPTANIYFPMICDVRYALNEWDQSSDYLIKEMATIMLKKYNEYWSDVITFLAVAMVLDPRFKMSAVCYYYKQFYKDHELYFELEKVKDLLRELVGEYSSKEGNDEVKDSNRNYMSPPSSKVGGKAKLSGFAKYLEMELNHAVGKSELHMYLEAPNVLISRNEIDNFDILMWWKTNGSTFPILQMIARDILSIPVSNVASELTYNMGKRVLSTHHSRLPASTLEALMCARNWIWTNIEEIKLGGDDFKELEHQQLMDEIEEQYANEDKVNED